MLVYYKTRILCFYGIYACLLLLSNRCAYYNTFYNAEDSFSKAVQIIQNAPILEDNKLPSESITLLNKVISNCDLVIQKYPNSKYVNQAYFLKGVSYFYKKSYELSIKNLDFLINQKSDFSEQASLWITYSHLRLNDFEKSANYLDRIDINSLNNDDLYIFYNIRAELSEGFSDIDSAYKFYILASENTTNDSRKIYIYRKLIYLSELSGDLFSKNKFISLLEPFIDNMTELRKLKIDWIDGKKEVGDYESIIKEVGDIIDQPDFQLIKPKLLLYKSKAYQQLDRMKASKDILNEIVDNYSRKNETSEAYYILGNLALFNDFDLDKSKDYYQKSIDEKSRSDHAKKAKSIKGKIEKYEQLLIDVDYFSNNSSIDTLDIELNPSDMNMSMPKFEGVVKIDSLIFEIGQIFYFDFNNLDSALVRYEYIMNNYPESKYQKQVSRILSFNSTEGEFKTDEADYDDVLFKKRDTVWSINGAEKKRDYYKALYDNYGDSIALFNSAYIEDVFLNDTRQAVLIYTKIVKDYARHPNMEYILERLSDIKIDVNNLIKENNFNLRFNDAITLLKSYQLDSARAILQNIVVSRKSPLYQTVNSTIRQIDLYDNLNNANLENETDSLLYKMGEIEYYYFYNDSDSKEKMNKIITKFPKSRYADGAKWMLNRKLGEIYQIDSLNYNLIDTSIVRLDSPVKNLDINSARNDSVKLDDILLFLEKAE
tara:strand:+ start:261 stop:2399 length:2139 start_codon:yes stop_codon:yes gene_type:complete